ncbi:MAG: nitrogen fixation protein NifQ [Betaproteobacteria bacterium]|nr:nitrogen fixation protein NifQ [Betaproteobacteria bacterium]
MQQAVIEKLDAGSALYARLMAHTLGLPNDDLLARMFVSQMHGVGVLPPRLGLDAADWAFLLARHFPGYAPDSAPAAVADGSDRLLERQDLIDLLLEHRAGIDLSELWLAQIAAAACMGGDHLWQDLGLWSRADLSRLMNINFPALAQKNDRDMKWKKFLYRQLCEREGIHVCPAPSCQACADYAKCFGSEG